MDWETLYNKYYTVIYLRCLRMMNKPELAEEAAQDTFVRAGQSLQRFIPFKDPKHWLYRIATNVCLNMLDRASNKREIACGFEVDSQSLDHDTEAAMITPLHLQKFLQTRLDARQRLIFSYRFIDGMTHAETARLMHCTKRTIISHSQRISSLYKEWIHAHDPS